MAHHAIYPCAERVIRPAGVVLTPEQRPADAAGKVPISADTTSQKDERANKPTHMLAGLLASWGHTVRLLVIAVVVIAVAALVVWLLPVELHLGPVHVTRAK